MEDVGEGWAKELADRVGRAVKSARGGKSAAWLSDRTAELGYRISPTVIAKLDSGHRGSVLSVAELLILAAALEVPPVALLFPELPDGDVSLFPGTKVRSENAMRWFSGDALSLPFHTIANKTSGSTRPTNRHAELVEAVHDRRAAMRQLLSASRDDVFRQQIAELKQEVSRLNAKIHQLGGVVAEPGADTDE
jgi:hypothetical protein